MICYGNACKNSVVHTSMADERKTHLIVKEYGNPVEKKFYSNRPTPPVYIDIVVRRLSAVFGAMEISRFYDTVGDPY